MPSIIPLPRTIVRPVLAAAALARAGGGAPPNQSLVSGASPAFTNNVNVEPQSPNSLPPYAAGLQSSGPNNASPNYIGTTFRAF